MCGILAILGIRSGDADSKRDRALELARKLRHRGPDWSGIYCKGVNIIAHERLEIMDVEGGAQPLFNETRDIVMGVNGEIYNYKELRAELEQKGHTFYTNSDCEVIIHLYEEEGPKLVHKLIGMWAFLLYDEKKDVYLAARDHIGIIPLYQGWGLDGSSWFSSELKAILDCESFSEFQPGTYYLSSDAEPTKWYNPNWEAPGFIPNGELDLKILRESFEKAVVSHMMSDVPYAVLLSGGLDSSLVASIMVRQLKKTPDMYSWARLHSFSIGLKESPDLIAAKEVALFLGTVHHSFHFTVEEGINALSDVIYHLETYDVTTIRASTPMYLLSRKIKAMGVKMVLSGEGSDEIFGGYLYFHKAPNKVEFHNETVRKLAALHSYDCLRANKATAAFGLECRPPFLDKEFLDVAMNIDPQYKMIRPGGIEKEILRKAFDTPDDPYLPSKILWRQKEQFSDGVGYSWIDGLKEYSEKQVSNATFAKASKIYPENTPHSKEAYLYRSIFEKHFSHSSARATVPWGPSVACSSPIAIEWDAKWKTTNDPSGRAVAGVHSSAYHDLPTNGNGESLVTPSKRKREEEKE